MSTIKRKICKGCSNDVQKPVSCPSCNTESPGQFCLARSEHPWHNGQLFDCKAISFSTFFPDLAVDVAFSPVSISSQEQGFLRSEIRNLSSLIKEEINELRSDYKTEVDSLHRTFSALLERIAVLEKKLSIYHRL